MVRSRELNVRYIRGLGGRSFCSDWVGMIRMLFYVFLMTWSCTSQKMHRLLNAAPPKQMGPDVAIKSFIALTGQLDSSWTLTKYGQQFQQHF